MSEIQEEMLSSLCKALEDESKSRRKSALQSIRQETIEKITIAENSSEIFAKVFKPLLKSFSDSAEVCRDLAISIVSDFIPLLQCMDSYLPYIITTILKRIGEEKVEETSEEVRLSLVLLLCKLISKSQDSLLSYLNDITKILTRALGDSYPNIKLESYNCVIALTHSLTTQFHVQSESYVKALLPGLVHKHSKVRTSCISTLGLVLQHGTHGMIEKVTGALAERLYDSNPTVRKTVIQIAGSWLTKLPDRYSQYARIIPLVLTGLDDEMLEVREEAQNLWNQAGLQYLDENEEQYKKQIDYLPDLPPQNYPLPDERPSLGCRILVQKEAGKLFPAALSELHDWTLAVQLQAASLSFQLVRHLEERSVQHIHRLWPELCLICGHSDLDPRLVSKVQQVCCIVGYFVPTDTLLVAALPQPQLSHGQLQCLSCTLRGITSLQQSELSTLSSALAVTSSTSMQFDYQSCVLDCISEVVRAAVNIKPCSDDITLSLFTVLLAAQGQGDPLLATRSTRLLEQIADIAEMEPSQLFARHGNTLLTSLQPSVPVWTDFCAEKSTFSAFVQGAGVGVGPHLDLIAEILVVWAQKAKTAKSLADLVRVSQPLLSWKHLQNCTADPNKFMSCMLNRVILPSLVWQAGRTAEAKRSAGLLLLLLAVSETLPSEVVAPLLDKLLPLLVCSLEETSKTLRLHAAQAISLIIPSWSSLLSTLHVQKTCNVLTGRLDDANSEVRVQALKTLEDVLLSLPSQHETLMNPIQLETVYKSLLIHLDDPDPTYQKAVLETLKKLSKIGTIELLGLLKKCKNNFRNQEDCDILQCELENLLANKS